MGTAQEQQREEQSIRGLVMNRLHHIKIVSLELNENMYLFDRSKMNIPATGESEYEHLWFLTNPSYSRRVFAYSLDARNLVLTEGAIVEKIPFRKEDFGHTHYIHAFNNDKKLIKEAIEVFGGKV